MCRTPRKRYSPGMLGWQRKREDGGRLKVELEQTRSAGTEPKRGRLHEGDSRWSWANEECMAGTELSRGGSYEDLFRIGGTITRISPGDEASSRYWRRAVERPTHEIERMQKGIARHVRAERATALVRICAQIGVRSTFVRHGSVAECEHALRQSGLLRGDPGNSERLVPLRLASRRGNECWEATMLRTIARSKEGRMSVLRACRADTVAVERCLECSSRRDDVLSLRKAGVDGQSRCDARSLVEEERMRARADHP
ncbi:hypothetical protein C8R44DRAFT_861969 [Mycena epipterygia]|nr:hypothetical protein C8R44DRAFT_861969 [Mycena epipterygia]